jgi:DNA helicase-2/ATP-dependent DNA helicase PcrA
MSRIIPGYARNPLTCEIISLIWFSAMINYEKELNLEQLRVVMEEGGPLLVIAGAGSGKTRTLTYRVARLIETGVKPERILLATFTNKAARSMLSRVKHLVDADLTHLWGGTFHHIAHLILRKNAQQLGYDRNFTIIDTEDASQLINTCISEKGIVAKGNKFPKGDVLRDIISLSLNMEVPLDEIVLRRYPYLSSCVDNIKAVSSLFTSRKKALNVMDFDDLLLNWKKLLLNFPEVLSIHSERFTHVLVDEYQDTNIIQAEIIDLMASKHRNLMVVGDDSQSIYAFRGANYANIFHFPKRYPECKVFKLEINYRSTTEILHLANLSIINNERQFHKELRAVRGKGLRPVLAPAENVAQQANFVAQRILELYRDGVPLDEIVVLYRAHYHSMELQMELTRRGIPYEIRSGIRFFEQAHIKDVTAYMRIIANPFDELAWKRVLCLYSKIGKVTAEKIWKFVSKQEMPLNTALSDDFSNCITKTVTSGLIKLQNTLKKLLNELPDINPPGVIETLLDNGYREFLQERYTDYESREEDLYQLAFFSAKFPSLQDFLSEVALLTNMTEEGEADPEVATKGKIILSTIHQAKGLEWSVVMLIWCADGMLPLARALKDPDGEEEERRLFYVAATRAKDQLYLCYPLLDYSRGMGNMVLNPSRFIRELSPSERYSKSCPYDQWIINENHRY